jgi:uncharacterized 2Fe-2S/4Fe-4S cluster protein (DUF4445 family)
MVPKYEKRTVVLNYCVQMIILVIILGINIRHHLFLINQEKTKYTIVGRKNALKQNNIRHLKVKNYKFERVENFKYLGVTLNEDNNHQADLQ